MPPEPVIPTAVRSTLVFSMANNDFAEVVLHWGLSGSDPISQLFADDLSNAIATAWVAHLAAVCSNKLRLIKGVVQDLRQTPYPKFHTDFSTGGSSSTPPLPWQNAIVASYNTATPGRSGMGRSYWPGFTTDQVDTDGTVLAATVTRVNDMSAALAAIVSEASQAVAWSVCSRKHGVVHPITAWHCDNRWDVQRRRANVRTP